LGTSWPAKKFATLLFAQKREKMSDRQTDERTEKMCPLKSSRSLTPSFWTGVARWVSFQTKNHNLGKFWWASEWEMLI
jgi:hypothetical protein